MMQYDYTYNMFVAIPHLSRYKVEYNTVPESDIPGHM